MLDTTELISTVDRLADRLRALPESKLRRGAAAEGLAAARELALRAQRLEFPGAEPRPLPEAGIFAVGDQVAVAGHDLAAVLRERGPVRPHSGDEAAGGEGGAAEGVGDGTDASDGGVDADGGEWLSAERDAAVALVVEADLRVRR